MKGRKKTEKHIDKATIKLIDNCCRKTANPFIQIIMFLIKIPLRMIAFIFYITIFCPLAFLILFIAGNKGCDKWAELFFGKMFGNVFDSFD